MWNNAARTLLKPLQHPNIKNLSKGCAVGERSGGGGVSDRKLLCLNFVSEDLVNIYVSLCPSSRSIRNRKVLLEYSEYMKMFLFDDDFFDAAQSSHSTEKKI